MDNPEAVLGIKPDTAAIESDKTKETRKLFDYLESKEKLNSVPRKTFSVQTNSVRNQILYDQYYTELLNQYEGTNYKTKEFESYIIETYLRRKEK